MGMTVTRVVVDKRDKMENTELLPKLLNTFTYPHTIVSYTFKTSILLAIISSSEKRQANQASFQRTKL